MSTVIAELAQTYVAGSHPLDELVNQSLPAVKFLASRLVSRIPYGVELDDLVQAGVIGLLQSADRFDPTRGVKFQTYANRRVQGAMLDYLRSLDWKPRSVRNRNRKLEQAFHDAGQRLGTRATEEDVAEEIGISIQELEQWMDAFSGTQPAVTGEEKSYALTLASLADPSESPEEALEKEQMRRVLVEAIEHLPKNERLVLSLYYYDQITMQEIGAVMGLRQARISQLHSQAVLRLRRRLRRVWHRNSLAATRDDVMCVLP